MSNLAVVKHKKKTITLNDGVEREIRFTLNAMAELEDRYGSVEAAFAALEKNSIKAVRCVLWASLIDASPDLTEQQVGSLIDLDSMEEIMRTMTEALGEDMPDNSAEAASNPNA